MKTYVDADKEEIDQYVTVNATALKTIFADLDFHLLISNHSIMQPLYSSLALDALNKKVPHIAVIHGSCSNFSLRKNELLKDYALNTLEKVDQIVLISTYTQKEFIDSFVFRKCLHQKTIVVPAGADVNLFRIISIKELNQYFKSKPTSLLNLEKIRAAKGQTILFISKLLWTKDPHVLLASAPLVLKEHPDAYFMFTGVGSFEKELKLLLEKLANQNRKEVLTFFLNSPIADEANPSDSQIFFSFPLYLFRSFRFGSCRIIIFWDFTPANQSIRI